MGFVDGRKSRLIRQLRAVQAQLGALYESMTSAASSDISSYGFDSGEGSQRTTRRSYQEILDAIARLERTEEHLINELYGCGLLHIKLRRKL